MTGLVWAPLSGNVFDTVSGTFTFSDDDVRAVYIDWGDGVSNKKSEANYQWKQLTEPKSSIEVGHTYTASSSATGYNPVIQTMNSKGFFSKYYTYGAVAGTIGTNTDITPSVDDTGIGRIIIYDGQATGIMRVENKTVKSGIDNSIFDKEGPKQLYLMVPPLCTAAELLTIDNITIEIKAVVDYSLIATGTDTTVVGGAGRGVHTISTELPTAAALSGAAGLYEVVVAGGEISEVLKVTYKNPKHVGDSAAAIAALGSQSSYTQNSAYKNLKIFVVAKGDEQIGGADNYYPITYVSAGSPIKKGDDPSRYITMDFSQSRAKASNVSLDSYRYDSGNMWLTPANQWQVTGTARSEYFTDVNKQTSELKTIAYTYSNVRPDGLNGYGDTSDLYTAFPASSATTDWARDASDEQNKRVDQFVVDEFGRFTDQYHMVRMSADPATTRSPSAAANVSSIVDNQPYVFRITPVGCNHTMTTSGNMTKIDLNLEPSVTSGNYTADYTSEATYNGSGNMISLSGMNTQTFKTANDETRIDNEYLILLFSSKTNKLFLNMNNYSNQLMDKNLAASTFTTPWVINGLSYLAIEGSGAKQNAHWKTVQFDDTTKVAMEYTDSDTYTEQSNSLSQSGYLSFDMPTDWSATTLTNLCGGEFGTAMTTTTSGANDIVVSGTATDVPTSSAEFGSVLTLTALSGSEVTGGVIDLATFGTAEDIGAFRYIAFCQGTGTISSANCENKPLWVANGTGNGTNSARNTIYLTYGEDDTSYAPSNLDGSDDCRFLIRRVNVYDIINGVSKVEEGATSGSPTDLVPVDAQNAAFPSTYVISSTGASSVGLALKTAWSDTSLYALKLSLSGSAKGSLDDVNLYPELWNIFDATSGYETIIKDVDDSAYNLNALPITSDLSIARGGTYYSAITRKGKVFIARTGDKIENLGFSSVGPGDGSTFATYSAPASMYGQLRKIRNLHARTARIYWDEVQRDGTFVRYWGVITQVDETHGIGSPIVVIKYNFNVMVEEIALIDANGDLMTDLFPLGGISDGRDYS
tara:strand:- start:523 stop:3633 length:3111 start_codon:yes stop_codon:yes gene_type:complete